MEDKELKRAGLDYHEWAEVQTYKSFDAFMETVQPTRVFAFSTRNRRLFTDAAYADNDALLFGPETRGLPQEMLDRLPDAQRLRLPLRPGNRSLNLSNAVAVAVFEAWRQLSFDGGA
jgi:tRNA (cytidine/uridine-2'-O-)-methyltransferase